MMEQAINYPTVPRGQEKLRVAPTPHHTKEMMDKFVEDVATVWEEVGLDLAPRRDGFKCIGMCDFCMKPGIFDRAVARGCDLKNCPKVKRFLAGNQLHELKTNGLLWV